MKTDSPSTPPLIAITGGIGSGKSVVSALLRVMGYAVYDCDRQARHLMQHDQPLRTALKETFGEETFLPDGTLNRSFLASQIFSDSQRLQQMNALVHPAVGEDLCRWRETHREEIVFYESAILYESGFDRYADLVWCVSAPLELRIGRTMLRDRAERQAVVARMESQMPQEEKEKRADAIIINDDSHSIIARVNTLLASLKQDR